MKSLYPSKQLQQLLLTVVKATLAIIFLVAGFYTIGHAQTNTQELVFKNPLLISGNAGAKGAIYKFPSVTTGIDALVTINDMSSSKVQLVSMDLTSSGYDKAFQPQVTYENNTSPAGNTDWWMEFQVSFVNTGTNTAAAMDALDMTGVDIDGNNDKISEYVSFYGLKSYTMELNSMLTASSVVEKINGIFTNVGTRFDGTVLNFTNVDTIATAAMVTANYVSTSSFRLRTGARSTGISGAADRMYSFWFKRFTYSKAIVNILPVILVDWSAVYSNSNIALKWSTTKEVNASHFIIERSFDGVEYTDAAMIVAAGNSNMVTNYSFNDKLPAGNSGIIYYRLKMVDMDARYKTSDVRIVRVGKAVDGVKILAYPNPVVGDVRITIPQAWQGKQVSYQVANSNGQIIKSYTVHTASQTEVIGLAQVPAGLYVVRAINGGETAVQSVVKANQ